MQPKIKLSTHVRFAVGTIIVAFIGSLISQPSIVHWISIHPYYDAFITAGGVAYNAYNTYSNADNADALQSVSK